MYLLDTNICIDLKNKKPKHVLDRLHEVIDQNLYISSITVAELYKEGKLINPYDMQIAAQAIAKKLILVTNNTDEFIRVDGIKLEDWR